MAETWATSAQVAEITGVTVTDALVAQAQSQIEVRVGRVGAATARIGSADLEWLKKAVAYQAAWLNANPDVVSRMDATSFNQDGASATVRADGMVLAPLARAALRRVSWRGSRSVHTAHAYESSAPFYPWSEGVVSVMDRTDDWHPWNPM